MFTRHLVALVLISATASACPNDPAFVTTDDASTSEATTADAPTTAADSSTGGDSTTGDSDGSSSTTTAPTTTTGAETINCGEPADECTPTNREWCVDIADLCSKTALYPAPGSGSTNYCELVAIQCADGVPPCQACNYIANTCKQLGGGEQACNDALADCLCRATEHGLDI